MMVSALHQHELTIGIHMSPPSWTSLPLPSPFHPSRLSKNTSLGFPESYSKFPLAIYFTDDNVYVSMLFSQMLFSSTRSFPHCVQKSVLYVYVSFAALQVGSSVLSSYSPYICINIPYLSFSFWLTSLCIIASRFIHLIRIGSVCSYSWVILHCVYVPQLLYPFICWWTSRLLPCPSYCK